MFHFLWRAEDSSKKAAVLDKTSPKFRQLNYIVLYVCNSVFLVISVLSFAYLVVICVS